MTAIDYAALIERLTRKNEDGTLCEITEDDQQEAADVIERLTQPVGEVESIRLVDSQWMNIVNHDRAYENYDTEDAVHLAVKLTEARMANNVAETVARLIAERDAAHEKYLERLGRNAELELERDALQTQVKTLRAALNDATDITIGHYGVDSRVAKMALEALAATEPKEKP